MVRRRAWVRSYEMRRDSEAEGAGGAAAGGGRRQVRARARVGVGAAAEAAGEASLLASTDAPASPISPLALAAEPPSPRRGSSGEMAADQARGMAEAAGRVAASQPTALPLAPGAAAGGRRSGLNA